MAEYVYACPHCGKKLTLHLTLGAEKPAPKTPPRKLSVESDLDADLEDYAELLSPTVVEGATYYTPKGGKFIESETWHAIDAVMRRHGGKWIPGAGDERHWEVPAP